MQRSFTNVLSCNVDKSARFYEQTLGMTRKYNSDWFVVLTHEAIDNLELGILQRDHEIVPDKIRSKPAGIMITFVVGDCDKVYDKALTHGVTIIEPPTDMPYGQRRMLISDPDGAVVDVSSLIL